MWARQLEGANKSYQILTIGESTHINDNRFLIPKSTVNNVRSFTQDPKKPSSLLTSLGLVVTDPKSGI